MNTISRYKSWSGLNKQLMESLCDELQGRITYFMTRYHEVHNAYGRAAIRLDDKELISFSWNNACQQEQDVMVNGRIENDYSYDNSRLKERWNKNCIYSEDDFLISVVNYLQLSIADALNSSDYIIRILAIMDRRVGKRTLRTIKDKEEYLSYPDWIKQFYLLRFECSL